MEVTAPSPAATPRASRRIALVGLPGAGKSAVGRALAGRLGWRLADLDEAVERAAGSSVAEIFAAEGEAGFRAREGLALEAALAEPGAVVVACGGGLVTGAAARERIARDCLVVWLDGPDDLLLARLDGGAARPLLDGDAAGRLAGLRAARAALYAAVAHLRVDVRGGDVDDVADRVADVTAGSRLPAATSAPGPGAGAAAPVGGAGADPAGSAVPSSVAGAARIRVDLGDRGYDVVVGAGILGDVVTLVPAGSRRVAVVADRAVLPVARRILGTLRASGRSGGIVSVQGGERLKTWARAGRLVEDVARLRLERGDCVVAVGGGTVGDVAGLAAGLYLRGVAVVHVPTTLLAMVDSAVGGKTGVNLRRGKNLAGVIWQPRGVLCDVEVLGTMPRRPLRAALAEVVKTAMISGDAALAGLLDDSFDALLAGDAAVVAAVVERCCAHKAAVVAVDEREAGPRAVLNYGHTVGHALESLSGYELLHGEAVAAGMRVAGRLSTGLRGCPAADVEWQDGVLRRAGLGEVAGFAAAAVLARTRADKKARAGTARWVLLEGRGRPVAGVAVDDEAALAAIAGVLEP